MDIILILILQEVKMLYFAIALLLLICFVILYKILLPIGEPDMTITGVMTIEQLKARIAELASNMKTNKSDSSLSSQLIRSTISKTYKKLSQKNKFLDFESWIYDNYYKLSEIMTEQKKLTSRYNKLPGYKNVPRLYHLASLIVKGSGGAVTANTVKECVSAFNDILPLTHNETTMLPYAIKLALLEYIAVFCGKSNVINDKFERAMNDIKANKIDTAMLFYNSYAYAFVKYANGELLKRMNGLIADGINAYQKADNFLSACVRYTGAVSSAIRSIHELPPKLSDEFLLDLSPLNRYLMRCEGIVYRECTAATKTVYLSRIAKKAKNKSEIAYAGEIVQKAKRENKDIAYYILPQPLGKFAAVVYILIIIGYTISNCVTVFMYIPTFKLASSIIFIPISLNLVLMFVTSINIRIFSRRYMPRVKIKDENLAMIVFPVIVFDEKETDEMIDNLLTVSCANSEDIFSYGLLLDLPSSDSNVYTENDECIIKKAKERMSALGDRFNLFIRKRTKVKGENKYQGWEKKRGAILELNNLIMSGEDSAFEVVCGKSYDVKYVITLDSDTMINCAYELVEIMEHPYNADKSVVSLNIRSDPSSLVTPFAKVMSDSVGLNNYSNFIADANYDIFGSGNYTGKGIYRVKEFTQKVKGVFMENRVLSHDFVEGAISGCGSSGESALDSYPATFSSYLSRNIRWLRGDYQLLPFLSSRIKDSNGRYMRNPLSIVARLHILNNIILGLIPISSAILLILSLFSNSPFWLTGVAFALNIFMFIGSIRLIFFQPKKVFFELLRQAHIALCLPVIAYNYFKAILMTLYRLAVKKNLLEWRVFAHSKGKVSFLPNIIAVAIYIAFAVFVRFKLTYVVMAVLFMSGIILAKVLDRRKIEKKSLTVEAEAELKKLAADTWIFFEKQLNVENNFLPFDNFQEEGDVGYAARTSPTDISFMITALVCAYNMEFVTKNDFDFYADNILRAIENTEKWKGNLFNWIDTRTLKRLNGYVSSVDSGNLLASLILLRNVGNEQISSKADKLIRETRLEAFFDEERGLLHIGYDYDSKLFDSNHYDLLGSEAMLTYLVGIGTGKLKSACFKNLSGRCVKFKGASLYSWTGGVFEYMMSALYFKYDRSGMLYQSSKAVMAANIAYAKRKKLPFWGISESQFNAVDENGNYQYKAFGVPNIALSNERRKSVVSPYSSMLFLPFFPSEVAKNLRHILSIGLHGEDGLYESYDDTIIKTYMTHHQGMILASICNYFYDDLLIKQMSSPDMKAAALLITMSELPKAYKKREYDCLPVVTEDISPVKRLSPPAVNLLTNGNYSVISDCAGNGYSYFKGNFVSRFYDFHGGLKLFAVFDDEKIDLQRTAYFHDGKTEFVFTDNKTEIKQVCSVLSGMDGEVRSIQIKNRSSRPTCVKLESYMEIALAPLYEDLAHKTFSGMFVSTAFDEGLNAMVAQRGGLTLAHYFDTEAKYQSNRSNYAGRGHGDDFGRVLDPIASGRVVVDLAPYEMKTIHMFNLVSTDYDKLKRQIGITKREGFFEKIVAGSALKNKGYGVSERMKRVMSKLMYDASPNLLHGELPLVYIESNIVTERVKNKLKLLANLGLWGLNIEIAFVYYGDGFVRERLFETLELLLGNNCRLTLINKEANEVEAALAFKSRTEIDEIDFIELKENTSNFEAPYQKANLPTVKYEYKLGKGGFVKGGEFALELKKNDLPPRPWSNIIANEKFGTIITESGGGYTFYLNSRENKLTEWSNDPIGDPCSEGVVIFEGEKAWSASVKPIGADADYQIIHGFGYSEFRCNYNGFYSRLREIIKNNTKYYELTLRSEMDFYRSVETMFFVSPVLGDFAFKTAHNLTAEFEDRRLKIANLFNGMSFVMGSDHEISSYVCHKQSYIDKFGKIFRPKNDVGYEFGPAISVKTDISPRGVVKVVFYLSADGDVNSSNFEVMIEEAKQYYSSLSCISVSTGDPAIDNICKWLPYQIMTSRFWGRTGFYQAGGAIGFRDQLQDCLGVLYIDPKLVRAHILDCAAHQFEEGDVQHWWHPPRTGVRTKITDDRLFLPYITAEYIEFTGDESILFERIPYLEDVKIIGKDYYGTPKPTVNTGTLLEHCLKAIKATARLGKNGLVLMGGGDWNDAMDKVGIRGKGTSVWGSMFLYLVISEFMPHIKNKKPYLALKERLRDAIDKAWDGEWFSRAFCDDGTVLGSKKSEECKIDLITQSFAVLSGCADRQKAKLALLSAASRLVDAENGIIKLLTPPLKNIKAGYICDYPPGVRENGGQYTHGAIWFIMSLFEIGEIDYAYALIEMIDPINHSLTPNAVKKYEVEPYVISADVYSEPAGKGGWSWYTGAAAWYYHVIIKYLLGIKFNGNVVTIEPKLPKKLKEVSFSIKHNGLTVYFKIDNSCEQGDWRLFVCGRGYNTNSIPLAESLDGTEITVRRCK